MIVRVFLRPKISLLLERYIDDYLSNTLIESEKPPQGLLPGRYGTSAEQYTVFTELGEVTAVLKGSFYYSVEARDDYPCGCDFVLLQYAKMELNALQKIAAPSPNFRALIYQDTRGICQNNS
jgi:hypothetical protein